MSKIISIFRKPDQWAESLILPHFPVLYSQAYKYTANRATAQDLVQDVFVYAIENKRKVLELDPVLPWLMKCLYHRFIDHLRKQKPQAPDDYNFELLVAPGASAEDRYFHEQVRQGLAVLTPEQKVAVTLFDIEGYSLEEVSNVMELPVNTVKSHLHRGRRRLKDHLQLTDELRHDHSAPATGTIHANGGDSHEL